MLAERAVELKMLPMCVWRQVIKDGRCFDTGGRSWWGPEIARKWKRGSLCSARAWGVLAGARSVTYIMELSTRTARFPRQEFLILFFSWFEAVQGALTKTKLLSKWKAIQ